MKDKIIRLAKEAGMEQDGDNFFSPGQEKVDVHITDLECFYNLAIQKDREALSKAIEAMPFGDTASSFAKFVRDFKQ